MLEFDPWVCINLYYIFLSKKNYLIVVYWHVSRKSGLNLSMGIKRDLSHSMVSKVSQYHISFKEFASCYCRFEIQNNCRHFILKDWHESTYKEQTVLCPARLSLLNVNMEK